MQDQQSSEVEAKLQTLFELFPHVDCSEVSDIYYSVRQNLLEAKQHLMTIYGERPDNINDQFEIIDEAGNQDQQVAANEVQRAEEEKREKILAQ